jgi:hypothetical protein
MKRDMHIRADKDDKQTPAYVADAPLQTQLPKWSSSTSTTVKGTMEWGKMSRRAWLHTNGKARAYSAIVSAVSKAAVYKIKAVELANISGAVDVFGLEGVAQVEEQQLGQGGDKLARCDGHIVHPQRLALQQGSNAKSFFDSM